MNDRHVVVCAQPGELLPCGKDAVAVVKVSENSFSQRLGRYRPMGEGAQRDKNTGSMWLPVCEEHLELYPDHDGFEIKQRARA